MLKSLEEITERLVEAYGPEKVILFGSHGTRSAREGSDIDLLIIKETEKRPMERRIEVEKILYDRAVPLDIRVYTPREVRELYAIGSPLIEEIMEKGRLLYMRKATSGWIREAEEEMDSARILQEHGKYRGACYHSQQSVEKSLKALILEKGRKPERTHDIVELAHAVHQAGWPLELPADDAVYLNSIYRGRYPTEEGLLPHGEPAREDAENAVAVAGRVLGQVKSLLGAA
jgi:HEPN domain-containing protein/predicted nucleotidyltransferase